jgi:phage major head subunit gpT-like protein
MDINAASIAELGKQYRTDWQSGLAWKAPIDLGFLFRDFPSAGAANFYAWLDRLAKFRKWVGDRVFNNVRSNKFEVTNVSYEDSVSMGMYEILNDLFGIYSGNVQMMAEAWQKLKYQVVIDVLTGNPVTFTGKAMLADDHAYGANTIDNLVTDALSETSFEAAFTAAAEYKFSNDEPCGTQFTHLLHGPKLHSTAFAIVDAEKHASGVTQVDNPNYKRCQRVEIQELCGTYDDYWFLVDGTSTVKAIARQIRREASPLMDADPATVMRLGRFDIMADGALAAAPTFPHLIYGGRL